MSTYSVPCVIIHQGGSIYYGKHLSGNERARSPQLLVVIMFAYVNATLVKFTSIGAQTHSAVYSSVDS